MRQGKNTPIVVYELNDKLEVFLKAILRFTCMSMRGKENVRNELGFSFMQ